MVAGALLVNVSIAASQPPTLRLPAEVKRISAWFILASARLTSMVIMGLAFPEPWIFIAMQKVPVGGGQFTFVPVPGPTLDGAQAAQMLNFRGGPQVVPAPVTINQDPITCRHAAFQKPPQPRSEHKGVPRRNLSTAVLRTTASGRSLTSSPTPRRVTSSIPTASPGRCCRKRDWNVRNFGWFKSFLNMGPAVPTATRRTATETAEVVEFINRELLGK